MIAPDPPISPRPDPTLSVVIVNYNSWPDVARLVADLLASPAVAAGRAEVVAVDNASDGPVPDDLTRPRAGLRLVLRGDNGGFAAGVNAGWRAARGEWLLLLNPDVEPGPDLIGRVLGRVEALRSRPGGPPGVVGFALRNPDGSRQPSVGAEPSLLRSLLGAFVPRSRRKYKAGWRTRPGPVPWVTGACALVDARLLDDLGGMDEDFFLYYEEVALCRSARDCGRSVEFDPTVAVTHLRPLQNRAIPPRLRVVTRHSKLLYFRKHLPRWQFLALSRIVAAEARIRGAWARARGRDEAARAWGRIEGMARAMRAGVPIRGRDVNAMNEMGASPALPPHLAEAASRRPTR